MPLNNAPDSDWVGNLKISSGGVRLHGYTTAERDALVSPLEGLVIYNTTTNKLNFYNGTAWEAVTSA
jgi:hypothetical protein